MGKKRKVEIKIITHKKMNKKIIKNQKMYKKNTKHKIKRKDTEEGGNSMLKRMISQFCCQT